MFARHVETRWTVESERACLDELSRRSTEACAWHANKLRKAVEAEAPVAGSYVQCFHNRIAGFADWALLCRNADGALRAAIRTQKGPRNVAMRTFSDDVQMLTVGELLDRYAEMRVNNAEAPTAALNDAAAAADYAAAADDAADRAPPPPPRSREASENATDNDDETEVGARRLPILRPPRRARPASDASEAAPQQPRMATAQSSPALSTQPKLVHSTSSNSVSSDYEPDPELERHAINLLAPIALYSRRERAKLDALAAQTAAQLCCRLDGPAFERWATAARLQSAAAPNPFYHGVVRSRCADALCDALVDETRARGVRRAATCARESYDGKELAPISAAVAVSSVICARALNDATTCAGAAQKWLFAKFAAVHVMTPAANEAAPARAAEPARARASSSEQPVSQSAVDDALAVSRAVLEALLRYHPHLGTRRDTGLAALEAVDRALFGDAANYSDVQRDASEKRYAAVFAAVCATTKDKDAAFRRSQALRREDEESLHASSRRVDGGLAASLSAVAVSAPSDRVSVAALSDRVSVSALRSLPRQRTSRCKLGALVSALEALADELQAVHGGHVAPDELMPALCESVRDADLPCPHAEVAFMTTFSRDDRALLGVEGYALTSFEIALTAIGIDLEERDEQVAATVAAFRADASNGADAANGADAHVGAADGADSASGADADAPSGETA